jgi:hypothetical protein
MGPDEKLIASDSMKLGMGGYGFLRTLQYAEFSMTHAHYYENGETLLPQFSLISVTRRRSGGYSPRDQVGTHISHRFHEQILWLSISMAPQRWLATSNHL